MGAIFQRRRSGLGCAIFRLFPMVMMLLCIPLLQSCDRMVLDHYAATDEAKIGRNFAEQLRAGDIETIAKQPGLSQAYGDVRPALRTAARVFPAGDPQIELVGYSWQTTNGVARYGITYQYSYPSTWLLVEVVLDKNQAAPILAGLHVYPLPESLERQSQIDFAHMGAVGIAALMLGLLSFIFSIMTLAWTWRAPVPRWRWLWRIAVLCGVGSWTVNLHTGAWAWNTLAIILPVTTGSMESYQAPLIVLHLPVFAVIYWLRQNKRRMRAFMVQGDIAAKF